MRNRPSAWLFLMALSVAVGGCSLLHHGESSQQQFIGAVQRGNSAQASQLWLHMSANDRANLAHSIGFKPTTSANDMKADLIRHQQAAEAVANAGGGGEFTGGEQTVEYPGLDTDLRAGSLQNLPSMATANPAPPTSDNAP